MTIATEPLIDEAADLRLALTQALAAGASDRDARAVYAARMNAAGNYVITMQGLRPKQRHELLALLYGHRTN